MGLLDKARSLLGQHGDKAERAIDKVADVVDDTTGGKYADQIDKGAEAAKDFVSGDGDETDPAPPVPPAVP